MTANTAPHQPKIHVRQLRKSDFSQIVAMQKVCFPGIAPWSKAEFNSQLKTFPEGQLCVEYNERVVASSSSLIVDFDLYSDLHTFKEISGGGKISNHDPEGDTLYGIDIMVHPDFRGLKLSRRLYDARKELVRLQNLRRIIIGGRIPGYGEHADEMSARDYVDKVIHKELYDPVLTAQLANGFFLKRLIPDYLPSDVQSRGYATFLEWANLDYAPNPEKRRLKAVSLARICCVQYEMRPIKNFDEFCQQCEFFVDVASGYQSDFLLFPELLTTQLLSYIKADRPEEAVRKVAEVTPDYEAFFTRMAVKYNVNIVAGSHLVLENDHLYNIAFLFRRDGTMDKQYKLHITPSERRWWGVQPGHGLKVFDTDRGKIAILICYDVEFPELARSAAGQGAQIVFVPFNTDERHGYLRVRYCAQARCIENHLYIAIAGATGNLPFAEQSDVHYAQSGIFSPSDFSFARDGIVGECTPNIETLIIHDVDTELLRHHKHRGTVQNWNDRRTDLYRLHFKDPDSKSKRKV